MLLFVADEDDIQKEPSQMFFKIGVFKILQYSKENTCVY